MRFLIVGDKYFRSSFLVTAIKSKLSDVDPHITIKTLDLPYPDVALDLDPDDTIPSGMSWDSRRINGSHNCGIREFYGEPEYLLDHISDTEILIVHGAGVPRQVIEKGSRLKLIYCLRGGPVNIDTEAASEKGITIMNTPGKNAQAVAEMTIGLLLAHLRHIPEAANLLRQGVWKSNYYDYSKTGMEISGKVFAIVGLGKIGQALTKILHGFGCKIIAYDPYTDSTVFNQLKVERCTTLKDLLSHADFISLHARVPDNSKPLIGPEELTYVKTSSIIINTARGRLLDYRALYDAIKAGKIAGAVLDVFGNESFGFYRELISLPQVTATPHICGGSQETVQRAIDMLINDLRDFYKNIQSI